MPTLREFGLIGNAP